MKRLYVALVMAGALSACTTSHTMMLAQDEAVISVQSHNSLQSAASVEDRALREAAKLTLARGYRFFVIEGTQDTTRQISAVVPGSSQTTGFASGIGNSVSYNATTTYTPPQVFSGYWIGGRERIKMFAADAPEAEAGRMYDARAILGL